MCGLNDLDHDSRPGEVSPRADAAIKYFILALYILALVAPLFIR